MAIRRASKFRFLGLCTTVGVMTVSACGLHKAASPQGGHERSEKRPVQSSDDEWEERQSVSVESTAELEPAAEKPASVVVTLPKVTAKTGKKESPPSDPVEARPEPTKNALKMSGALGGVVSGEGKDSRGRGVAVDAPVSQPKPLSPPPPPNKPLELVLSESKPDNDGSGNELSGASGNSYKHYRPNPWVATAEDRHSTFAADVDTASYTQARRFINSSVLPPTASVRVEEFVNYFNYAYAPPKEGAFTVHMEAAPSPFTAGRHLVKIGIKGKVLAKAERKPANLVFLIDTSGSMSPEDRLPLAKQALKIMVDNLNENDTVSIVTYAGSVQDILAPTAASNRTRIFDAIDSVSSGGGTSMGSGVELAYKHAVRTVSSRSVSRVVVLTDGDTNIGKNQTADQMLGSIKNHVEEGVTLTMVGFGMGNYRDTLMEKLADAGNGNCYYIDSIKEAKRVFQEKLSGTLEVIAKDVKLQVEFHPESVISYRLVGYENRDIADKDFRNDKVDAGEIGAGHTVTALYEVQLTGAAAGAGDIATVRIRAKQPSGTTAKEQAFSFGRELVRESIEEASTDFRFAAAVAGTADILRGNPQTEGWSLATAEKLARGSAGENPDRQEFVKLVQRARALVGDVNVAAR